MKVYVDIDGSVKIELEPTEVEDGINKTVQHFITDKWQAAFLEESNKKKWEYVAEVGKPVAIPIRDRLQSSGIVDFKDPEYLPAQASGDYFFDNRQDGMWTCSNCGAPNSVSQDEGCTNCDH